MISKKRKPLFIVLTLIPLILISVVIFRFSAQSGERSTEVSNSVTVRLLSLVMDLSEFSDEELEELVVSLRHKVRKTAHVLEYAAFGFFLALHLSTWLKKMPWLVGLGISALYGLSDELHQYFVGERMMQLKDVGFDLFGAALGIGAFTLLCLAVRRLRSKHNKTTPPAAEAGGHRSSD